MARGPDEGRRQSQPGGKAEYLIEIVTVGTFAKVSAVDPRSGTEVSVMGPAQADRGSLKAAAVAKLEYVLKKTKGTR
jgi:hypothetical protein